MRYYKNVRDEIQDGDVFMVEGQGFVSRFIRVVTAQSISHVAMLVWIGDNLFVAEMKEFKGYNLTPASLWLEDYTQDHVTWGKAPVDVRGDKRILEAAMSYRKSRYGYLSLLKVWWAQIIRKNIDVKRLVCSTFIMRCWMMADYVFDYTPDPGDYSHLCNGYHVIRPIR